MIHPRSRRPVVAVVADRFEYHKHAAHAVLEGYVHALSKVAKVLPLIVPAHDEGVDAETLVSTIDGFVLTGSPSNVAAERYGAAPLPPSTVVDPARDAVSLRLLPAILEAGVPFLGICRGFQELNVVFGGSLERAVHDQPGRLDHREGDHDRPLARWYEDRHEIHVAPGGRLEQLSGKATVMVNSLHHQGIERLGTGLRVEATAPDGLIEAISVESAEQFTLGVQWHPEMRVDDSPLAQAIFTAFGDACRMRLSQRLQPRFHA
ncbi:gamma-glutamyl-gamma-aminobutyrate hydrolase family protein [Paraburkholderia dinghuensis]|uniref:gamma-glutamyl-gamma-aminobutyrate hydrolase n=1 Tax=Paraburkholderia dinghuensis TaxID=2305225 RepID=A0A3N6MKS7_9BURK|nr:gamma-glutamyl-gamma-aminobutyrate hydrolase family protein [Paraburkholderia dinghuensis]RQH04394.1 gamma-glutamyl-gamma-aminobutyrate hydrolase family protein [Paraburkholderia dinghuensis]